MRCPYCGNEITNTELCPICGEEMVFNAGAGPHGTWECTICSTEKFIVGFRMSITGLIRVKDQIGRYKFPDPEDTN